MSISHRASRRGFSLLEVVIALTILALISGSIYSVLRGAIETAAGLRENQTRQEQIDGFLELCHQTFRMLPGQTDLEARVRQQDGKTVPEIIFRNAPQLFSWGDVPDLEAITVLGLKPEIGGRFSIALLRVNPEGDLLADPVAKARPEDWLVLVPEVRSMSWRFFDRNSSTWQDILPRGSQRPSAVELTLSLADQKDPLRFVFGVVPLAASTTVRPPNAPPPQP